MTTKGYTIYADGAIRADRAGVGVVAHDSKRQLVLLANRTLPAMTSNEAEYAGLMMALECAAQMRASEVTIRLDSELVVNQMNGRYAVNSRLLKPWHRKVCEKARQLAHVTYTHVPHTQNLIAHALATEAAVGRQWATKGAACSG